MGRRTYIKTLAGAAASTGASAAPTVAVSASRQAPLDELGLSIYFGDLHNHNSIGYGLGSPERAFDIARGFLDFYSISPHAYGDDDVTESMTEDILAGRMARPYIRTTHENWGRMLELVRVNHEPGRFVAFAGYERHSADVGDYNIMFPGDGPPLEYFARLEDFKAHARQQGALVWQHHPAYPAGSSGAVPEHWDPELTPILEIFSEHGNAESGTAPKDYIRHSGRGRVSTQTMQAFLERGLRFGVIASTDNHLGFPAAWGQGKAAVIADSLSREGILSAIRARRTYGVSGDKILLDFRLKGVLMGGETAHAGTRRMTCDVQAWDWLDRVEVLRNNRVIHRVFPVDEHVPEAAAFSEPLILRMEWGWAGMSENQVPRDRDHPVIDWKVGVGLDGARIAGLEPCWQEGPFDESRRHAISARTDCGFSLTSYHSRKWAFEQRDTHSVVMRLDASTRDTVTITVDEPSPARETVSLAELMRGDRTILLKGGSLKLHRLVPARNASARFTFEDMGDGAGTDWYYVRVFQRNGQLAWSSPVWVEKAI